MPTELSRPTAVAPRYHAPVLVEKTHANAFSPAQTLLKLPRLWSRSNCFYCDGQVLAFNRASRRITLLKAFLAARNHQLNRQQIITIVYGESQSQQRSLRYAECLNMNVLRTISDTRRQLYVAYGTRYPGLDWLYFNKGEKKWKLVRLHDDYVLSHLNAQIFHQPSPPAPSTQHSE